MSFRHQLIKIISLLIIATLTIRLRVENQIINWLDDSLYTFDGNLSSLKESDGKYNKDTVNVPVKLSIIEESTNSKANSSAKGIIKEIHAAPETLNNGKNITGLDKKDTVIHSFSEVDPNGRNRRKSFWEKLLEIQAKKKTLGSKKDVNNIRHKVDSSETSLNDTEIDSVKHIIENINKNHKILNDHLFSPIIQPDIIVIIIQVHNRLENLKLLIKSLEQARGINETLVIFSHDYWYPDMNAFIETIQTFRVMQIFFPFSIQLHPNKYPGRDPRDCVWNHQVAGAEKHKCLNQMWPDTYKHYREASFTQIKHHWWWKINWLFEEIFIALKLRGDVIFLEEDHYVSPDILYTLKVLQISRNITCPSTCKIIALGNYKKLMLYSHDKVDRGPWLVNKHNLGFALNQDAWAVIKGCSELFCNFDDYNWDWTLQRIVQTCAKDKLEMLSPKLSRVFHIGNCGTHVRKQNCDVQREASKAEVVISQAEKQNHLFKDIFQILYVKKPRGKLSKVSGGWGDNRDKALCLAISNKTATDQQFLHKLQL